MTCFKCGRSLDGVAIWRLRQTAKGSAHRICPKRRGHQKSVRLHIKGVDLEETKGRNFTHPESRVMLDGREILLKDDYKVRVREVHARSGTRCENVIDGTRCSRGANDHPHHRVKRSVLRDDRIENLMDNCNECMRETHPEHKTQFGRDRAQAIEDFNRVNAEDGRRNPEEPR